MAYAYFRSKAVVHSMFIVSSIVCVLCVWSLFSLVMQSFMCFLALQLSSKGIESLLLYFYHLPSVL